MTTDNKFKAGMVLRAKPQHSAEVGISPVLLVLRDRVNEKHFPLFWDCLDYRSKINRWDPRALEYYYDIEEQSS